MKKTCLLFSFFWSIIPSLHPFTLQKENLQLSQFQTQGDYLYTENEIIKEFYDPVATSDFQPQGYLHCPERYDRTFKFQLEEKDLNLIWKESLETRLEFDLKLFWEGQSRNEKIETHLSQFLDLERMEEPLICGTIPWECLGFPNLKFKPIIKFSWIYEEKSLFLEHKINSSLNSFQNSCLADQHNNGLVKMFFEMSNIKLIYEIPSIFNQVSQVDLNLEYWADLNSLQEINHLIADAILNDSTLKKLKFTEYFENPVLTIQQKESLLNISDDFQVNFQILLQLKPKYQEEIFDPLLKKLHLKISFFQLINLNQLKLNSKLKIKPDDDPWNVFLNQNLNYKFFFENDCLFQITDNYLFIEPKPEYSNLSGTLNFPIEYEKIVKKDLNNLGLDSDLGTFELENSQQILSAEEIFNRWKQQNSWILGDEKFGDYLLTNKNENDCLIQAVVANQSFEGTIKVYFKKIYLDEPENEDPIPDLKIRPNFFQKYWWILIIGLLVVGLIIWFIWKIFKDKKTGKS